MRVLVLSGALALSFVLPASAQTSGSGAIGAATPNAQPATPRRPPLPTPSRLDNDKAQRETNERQKHWDERMKRATGNVCDRC